MDNIDHLFKSALGSYTEAPPPDVWDTLEKRLDSEPKKRPGLGYRWMWVALSFCCVMLLSAAVIWKMNSVSTSVPPNATVGTGHNPMPDSTAAAYTSGNVSTATRSTITNASSAPAATVSRTAVIHHATPVPSGTATTNHRPKHNTGNYPRKSENTGANQQMDNHAAPAIVYTQAGQPRNNTYTVTTTTHNNIVVSEVVANEPATGNRNNDPISEPETEDETTFGNDNHAIVHSSTTPITVAHLDTKPRSTKIQVSAIAASAQPHHAAHQRAKAATHNHTDEPATFASAAKRRISAPVASTHNSVALSSPAPVAPQKHTAATEYQEVIAAVKTPANPRLRNTTNRATTSKLPGITGAQQDQVQKTAAIQAPTLAAHTKGSPAREMTQAKTSYQQHRPMASKPALQPAAIIASASGKKSPETSETIKGLQKQHVTHLKTTDLKAAETTTDGAKDVVRHHSSNLAPTAQTTGGRAMAAAVTQHATTAKKQNSSVAPGTAAKNIADTKDHFTPKPIAGETPEQALTSAGKPIASGNTHARAKQKSSKSAQAMGATADPIARPGSSTGNSGGTGENTFAGTTANHAKHAKHLPADAMTGSIAHQSEQAHKATEPSKAATPVLSATAKHARQKAGRLPKNDADVNGHDPVTAGKNLASATTTDQLSANSAARHHTAALKHNVAKATTAAQEEDTQHPAISAAPGRATAAAKAGHIKHRANADIAAKAKKNDQKTTANQKVAAKKGKPMSKPALQKQRPAIVLAQAQEPIDRLTLPAAVAKAGTNNGAAKAEPKPVAAKAADSASAATDSSANKSFWNRIKMEAGVKAGFESGLSGTAANKFLVSPYLEFKLSRKVSFMVQPSFKTSFISDRRLDGTQSFYSRNNDSNITLISSTPIVVVLGDTLNKRTYAYTQSHDSLIKSYAAHAGHYQEYDLPVLFKYNISSRLAVYGGVNITYSRYVYNTIKEGTSAYKITQTVDTFTIGPFSGPAPVTPNVNTVIHIPGNPISAYTGPLYPAPPSGGVLRFGYMLGFSYEFQKRWLADVLITQGSAKTNTVGGINLNQALSAPYYRFTLGYRLWK